jgi:hypothetical protein
LSQGLIYRDPSREFNFWRPTPSALLALGLRSHTDIPALKELEEWLLTERNSGNSEIGSFQRKAALIFSGVMGPMLLGGLAKSSRRKALCRAARLKGAPLGPGKRSPDWLHWSDLR